MMGRAAISPEARKIRSSRRRRIQKTRATMVHRALSREQTTSGSRGLATTPTTAEALWTSSDVSSADYTVHLQDTVHASLGTKNDQTRGGVLMVVLCAPYSVELLRKRRTRREDVVTFLGTNRMTIFRFTVGTIAEYCSLLCALDPLQRTIRCSSLVLLGHAMHSTTT